jgi:hypothetical protein
MQGSIFNGIYSLNAPDPFICSTANCDWPDFATLAICTSCEDVTATTNINCEDNPRTGSQLCNYTTPSGHNLSANTNMDAHTGFSSTLLNSTATSVFRLGDLFNDTLLINSATIILPPIVQGASGQPDTKLPPAVVTECTIRWCAQVYEGNQVTGNILKQSRISNIAMEVVQVPADAKASKIYTGLKPADGQSTVPGNNTFLINTMDHANTANYLESIFTVGQASTNANSKVASVNDISNPLLQTNNVSVSVQNLAKSMSMRIRTGPNSTLAVGQAFHDDTFIQVAWLWIIFPASMVFFAIILLILTIWRSVRAQAPVWKSSSLAMLLHDMTGYQGTESYDRVEEMEKVAKKVEVRLVRGASDKWGFERV